MKKNNVMSYEALYEAVANNVINVDFTWGKNESGKYVVTDNSNYQVIFDLQNSVYTNSTYDIEKDIDIESETYEKHKDDRTKLHEANYVALMKDDKSIIQLHGKKDRIIIEIRKQLYEKLECEKVKIFRECEKNEYKHIKRDYQLVVYSTNEAVKIINEFLRRLEKKTVGKTENETSATEKEIENEKAQ